MKVLVTGATGNVGSHVIRDLRGRGVSVRAFVRDPDRAAAMLGNGVELASGDFSDATSVRHALEDVGAVFLSCSHGPHQVEYEVGTIDAAVEAGVRRIVKLSALGAEVGSPLAVWDRHGKIEAHLQGSAAQTVVLRPSFYMTNLLGPAGTMERTGRLFVPPGGARIAMIDPRDVAAVAAVALAGEGHAGMSYALTGPEAMTNDEISDRLSEATGGKVGFADLLEKTVRGALVGAGAPELVAGRTVALFVSLGRGAHERTTEAVRVLTGRKPRTLARFARDHATLFRAS